MYFYTVGGMSTSTPPVDHGLVPPANFTGHQASWFKWYQGQPGQNPGWTSQGDNVDCMKLPLAAIAGQNLYINVLADANCVIQAGAVVEVAAYTTSDDTPGGPATFRAPFAKYCWGNGTPATGVSLTDNTRVQLATPADVTMSASGIANEPYTAPVLTLEFASANVLNGFVNKNQQAPTKMFINVAIYQTLKTPAGALVHCWEDPEMEIDAGTSTRLEMAADA